MQKTIPAMAIALLVLAAPASIGARNDDMKLDAGEAPAVSNASCSLGAGTHPLADGVTMGASLPNVAGASCEFSYAPAAGPAFTMVTLAGMTSDFDLYVKRGAPPTTSSWECRPFSGGTQNETCTVANDGQVVFIMVLRWSGSGPFTIKAAAYTPPPPCSLGSGTTPLEAGAPVTASLTTASGANCKFSFEPSPGADFVSVDLTGLAGSFDLYVRVGSPPTTTGWDCRPFASGTANESCTVDPAGQIVYAMVHRWSGSGSFTITATELIVPTLENGVPVAGSSTPDSFTLYKLIVPEDDTTVSISLAGDVSALACSLGICAPDADLYVARGKIPSFGSVDCRPFANGSTEACLFSSEAYGAVGDPASIGGASVRPFLGPGKYFVAVHGYAGAGDWVLTGVTH